MTMVPKGRSSVQRPLATGDSRDRESRGSPASVCVTAPLDVMRGVSARRPSDSSRGIRNAVRRPVATASVMPACCTARKASALRGLMLCEVEGSSVPSMSTATSRSGGCIVTSLREQGTGNRAPQSAKLSLWNGSAAIVTRYWQKQPLPIGARHAEGHSWNAANWRRK